MRLLLLAGTDHPRPLGGNRLDMAPDFSVIIPAFRRPRELASALASVLAQDEVSVEILVVDDSPEGSAHSVIESLNDSRVMYLKNPQPSAGFPSIVRNLGWPLARGKFVHFLDDDDLVPQGYYFAAKSAFIAHPDVGVVFGRVEPFGDVSDEQIEHEREFFRAAAERAARCARFGSKLAFAGRMMFDGLLLVTGAGLIRRECVEQLGGFDPHMRVREDWDFFARAMRKFGACFLDSVALQYRIGKESILHYGVDLSERDLRDLGAARERKRAKYRAEYGITEYYALKLFTKTVLEFL
jgi:glycosyltransferase involved in cell wall biosynthesis